ncbi:hypothetical protein DFS33DRAFT_1386818 [Desarmillaria ectypa]|nr:hypothetical protein DFS33DRAFT_1386818 [Desarmillaria ectypa]
MFRDFSVYLTINNNTREALVRHDVDADHGEWINVPNEIGPGARLTFRLKDAIGPTGTYGWFSFQFWIRQGGQNVSRLPNTYLKGRLKCAYSNKEYNTVDVNHITPTALYVASFRVFSGKGRWTEGTVEAKGHPLHVEVTVGYAHAMNDWKFQVERITAPLNHPVRNTRNRLIEPSTKSHELWNRTQNDWIDDRRGSFQPNIFGYDFVSGLSNRLALTVTVRVPNSELIEAEAYIHGRAPRSGVTFQSGFFVINTLSDITVDVHIVQPHTSLIPFALNADVEWGMALRLSGQAVPCSEPKKTRLELYWIAQPLHQAFMCSGIPIEFLRAVLPSPSHSNFSDWNKEMTRRSFEDFSKIYNTMDGKACFGPTALGGSFQLSSYLERDESGRLGGAIPYVNCIDQAAILELSCSLGRRTGEPPMNWVEHEPFGYINSTHLVGIRDRNGELIHVNNPFFRNRTECRVHHNDSRRTMFLRHVYLTLGSSGNSEGVANCDHIYDACCGPHLGDETLTKYWDKNIDNETRLYDQWNMHPGTSISDLTKHPGITCIDEYSHPASTDEAASAVLKLAGLTDADTAGTSSITYAGWAHVEDWIKEVLDDSWCVMYGRVGVGEMTAHSVWRLKGQSAEINSPVRLTITVHVESQIDADGVLDMSASRQAARCRFADIINSTDARIESVWTRGELYQFSDYSVRYPDDLPAECIVVVAGQTVIEIRDDNMLLTAETFERYAHKLLEHTVRRNSPLLTVPVIKRGPLLSLTSDNHDHSHPRRIQVRPVKPWFSIWFEMDKPIAAADGIVSGSRPTRGINLQNCVIEEGVRVEFIFVIARLGHHVVSVHTHFADSDTMVSTSQLFEVEVFFDKLT